MICPTSMICLPLFQGCNLNRQIKREVIGTPQKTDISSLLLVQLQDKVSNLQNQISTDSQSLQHEIATEVDQLRTEQAKMKAEVLQQVQTEMNVMKENMGDVQIKMNEYHPNTEGTCMSMWGFIS